MHIGIVGLGRMGMNIGKRLVADGHKVTAYNKTSEKVKLAEEAGMEGAYSLKEIACMLTPPRILWIMVPAGEAVDEVIATVKGCMDEGDIIIDGGNSFYKDSIRRAEELKQDKIKFMDIGVSGGIFGLKEGYCLMAGGDRQDFDTLEPALKSLSAEGGYMYMGPLGAGHFTKMVHNGIEYGMMEAYAEGFDLVKKSPYGGDMDYVALSKLWNSGSVIRSWLLELLENAFEDEGELLSLEPYVQDSGEGRWTVMEAVELGVPVPVIADALFRRFRSKDPDSFAEKVLAALRREFGGHAVRSKDQPPNDLKGQED